MDQELAVRLKADGSGLVGEVRASSDEMDKFGKSVERAQGSTEKYNDQQRFLLEQIHKSTQGTSDLTKRQVEMAGSLDKLMSSIDPAFRGMLSLSSGQEILTRSLGLGLITQVEHDAALAKLTARYAPAGAAALGLATHTAFLTRETRALFDEIASGRSRQAIGTSTLLVTRLFDIGPAGIASLVGIAALAAGLGYLAYQGTQTERALNQIEVSFAATGRAGLISRDQLGSTIDQLARLPNVSRKSAEETVAALATLPTISGPMFAKLTAIAADFAAATGKKLPDAMKDLGKSFADPVKGAQTFDQSMKLLTA